MLETADLFDAAIHPQSALPAKANLLAAQAGELDIGRAELTGRARTFWINSSNEPSLAARPIWQTHRLGAPYERSSRKALSPRWMNSRPRAAVRAR